MDKLSNSHNNGRGKGITVNSASNGCIRCTSHVTK